MERQVAQLRRLVAFVSLAMPALAWPSVTQAQHDDALLAKVVRDDWGRVMFPASSDVSTGHARRLLALARSAQQGMPGFPRDFQLGRQVTISLAVQPRRSDADGWSRPEQAVKATQRGKIVKWELTC